MLETGLCPAVEFVFALLLTVEVERFTARLSVLVARLDVTLPDPEDCLFGAASVEDLLPLLFPEETFDGLSG